MTRARPAIPVFLGLVGVVAFAAVVGLFPGPVGTAVAAEVEPDLPISLMPVARMTADGPIRGWAATIDLSDPRVDVVVSDIDGDADLDDREVEIVEGAEVILTPMDSFVERTGVVLAFNANFFSWKEDAEGNKTQADIIGLSVSDSVPVSGPRHFDGGFADPALLFHDEGVSVQRLPHNRSLRLAKDGYFRDAVAGIGGSDTSDVAGTLLVESGMNLGHSARVQPMKRHPRTAAGISLDMKTLYVVVIDGRQFGHSVGATLPEMAELLIEMGTLDAVALDGGGSSSIIGRARFIEEAVRGAADPDGDGWVTNRPSDGRYRPIANQVGIRLLGAGNYDAPPAFVPGGADVWNADPLPALGSALPELEVPVVSEVSD